MLKGTQAGTWVSLSVRQKHLLPGRGTGGIGDLKVDAVWHWGSRLKDVVGVTFAARSPIFAVPE